MAQPLLGVPKKRFIRDVVAAHPLSGQKTHRVSSSSSLTQSSSGSGGSGDRYWMQGTIVAKSEAAASSSENRSAWTIFSVDDGTAVIEVRYSEPWALGSPGPGDYALILGSLVSKKVQVHADIVRVLCRENSNRQPLWWLECIQSMSEMNPN